MEQNFLVSIYRKNTIKTFITTFLIILFLINIIRVQDPFQYILQVLIIGFVIILIDSLFIYIKFKRLSYSKSGLITILILSGILPPIIDKIDILYILAAAIAAASSKYLITYQKRSILNPAAFGALVYLLISNSVLSWWIGNPEWLVLILGLILIIKGSYTEYSLNFLGTLSIIYFLYATITNNNLTILHTNFILTSLFFTFFMLTDPKTMSYKKEYRYIIAIIGAILVFITGMFLTRYTLIIPLLLMNILSVYFNNRK